MVLQSGVAVCVTLSAVRCSLPLPASAPGGGSAVAAPLTRPPFPPSPPAGPPVPRRADRACGEEEGRVGHEVDRQVCSSRACCPPSRRARFGPLSSPSCLFFSSQLSPCWRLPPAWRHLRRSSCPANPCCPPCCRPFSRLQLRAVCRAAAGVCVRGGHLLLRLLLFHLLAQEARSHARWVAGPSPGGPRGMAAAGGALFRARRMPTAPMPHPCTPPLTTCRPHLLQRAHQPRRGPAHRLRLPAVQVRAPARTPPAACPARLVAPAASLPPPHPLLFEKDPQRRQPLATMPPSPPPALQQPGAPAERGARDRDCERGGDHREGVHLRGAACGPDRHEQPPDGAGAGRRRRCGRVARRRTRRGGM